ncbi:phosphoenolpyruvate synthase [Quadrisphaera granulorum]|uniref:Phosphoenolpyruvate synthase n=1 Tax=Quadrisphaera granulorum TaxID=317664 RepID=A0A315ZQZ4_9ACTN|nr:PEP/pyruvate-binding domain-containing protein [Quadrisphaera granulorum]PWJ47702.1 phosphoenolpyruvate synthase [Quadrisphaera granulorum]SZE98656.1 phosphoenolpyruvate synthase [Quadrisphaera granulorum]
MTSSSPPAAATTPAATRVVPLRDLRRTDTAIAGGKAATLGDLLAAGFSVPPGYVVLTDAYEDFVVQTGIAPQLTRLITARGSDASDDVRRLFTSAPLPADLAAAIVSAWRELGSPPVAVRSSATTEDLALASSAGQQDTFLNVRTEAHLLDAVRACWASLWTARAIDYRRHHPHSRQQDQQDDDGHADRLALAVLVQQMVDADAAGVLFTADPATGQRRRTVISAAWGLGEAVVSGTVTPDVVVVDTARRAVVSRTTADQPVLTRALASSDGGTREEPVPDHLRRRPVLTDTEALALADLGLRVQVHLGAPQDVEWARDTAGAFVLLQARPITALPEPTGDVPTDWTVPVHGGTYWRASIVEQLPDPLTPLFADLAGVAVPRSLRALVSQALGEGAFDDDDDIRFPTVNGYAYYFFSHTAFVRMCLATPRAVVWLVNGKAHTGVRGWREHAHPTYAALVERWAARREAEMSQAELLAAAAELLEAGCTYYTAVQSVVPQAVITEAVFRAAYDRLARRPGDPPSLDLLLGLDSAPIRAETSLFDLAEWAHRHPPVAVALRAGRVPDDPAWHQLLHDHLQQHGHALYTLDFSVGVPADHPEPLIATLRQYLEGHGSDPHERQRRSAERRERATAEVLGRLSPLRRSLLVRLLRWAQEAGAAREDALSDIGLAWPTIRRFLRESGRRLAASGVLEHADDVFWLRRTEMEAAAAGDLTPLRDRVAVRKEMWRGQRLASPPQLLPLAPPWLQRALGGVMPSGDQSQTGPVVRGVGASGGQVTAVARVLSGPEDSARLRPGDVLVARMTTPAWTSLFAMASAVVTDVGGPLSHSSIVAREYGIPAVLGTGVATQRLTDGALVTVDGDAGTVTLVPEQEEEEEEEDDDGRGGDPAGSAERGGRSRWLALAGGAAVVVVAVLVVRSVRLRSVGDRSAGRRS